MKSIFNILLVVIATSLTLPAIAHHAISSTYDVNKTTQVQGVVTGFRFKSPHVGVYFDVVNEDGSITSWTADGSAATILRREGWTPDTLKAGDRIQIIGEGTHDGSPQVMMRSVSILNADGSVASEIFGSVEDFSLTYDAPMVERSLELATGVPNLNGIWTGQGSPHSPPRGQQASFNEAGAAVAAAYDLIDDHQVFCETPGIVRQGGMTPHGVRITQYEDRVVFEYEEYDISNVAYFDPAQADTGIKTHLGDSVARYEDGALIVETTNLLSAQSHAGGSRLSDQARVIQTYRRVDEPGYSSLMLIHTRAIDPAYLAEDFEITNIKMASVDYDFVENGCEAPLRERRTVHPAMNFFLTSVGPGDGANLGGLSGADAHCTALAENVGQGDKIWHAYLSTTGANGVDARDRIGAGPWYNAQGDVIGIDLDDLHNEQGTGWMKSSVITERAALVNGRGDDPNRHDILTGSLSDGTASNSDTDTTCSNWTSNSEGSALVGHFDLVGGGDNPTSWNSAHPSRGCSQTDLQGSGGDGLFYCFAVQP
jgi:hypothetical protein